MYPGFNFIPLEKSLGIWQGGLPDECCDSTHFESLWRLHPDQFPAIHIHGREVKLPRWQQAFGYEYVFSGKTSQAIEISDELYPYLEWAMRTIDNRLNGLLLNWYDGRLGHYIGAHRDSTVGLVKESVIVMISLGEERITRFRPAKGKGYIDIHSGNGSAIILPLSVNRLFKHEVPGFKADKGRRISITLRCFDLH